jgi:hypothetical protein
MVKELIRAIEGRIYQAGVITDDSESKPVGGAAAAVKNGMQENGVPPRKSERSLFGARVAVVSISANLLAGCTAQPTRISSDVCWDVHPGETVAGTVMVHGIVDRSIVEGGASITNTACAERSMGLIIRSHQLLQSYEEIMRTDPPQFVEKSFFISGMVSRGPNDRMRVEVTDLRAID